MSDESPQVTVEYESSPDADSDEEEEELVTGTPEDIEEQQTPQYPPGIQYNSETKTYFQTLGDTVKTVKKKIRLINIEPRTTPLWLTLYLMILRSFFYVSALIIFIHLIVNMTTRTRDLTSCWSEVGNYSDYNLLTCHNFGVSKRHPDWRVVDARFNNSAHIIDNMCIIEECNYIHNVECTVSFTDEHQCNLYLNESYTHLHGLTHPMSRNANRFHTQARAPSCVYDTAVSNHNQLFTYFTAFGNPDFCPSNQRISANFVPANERDQAWINTFGTFPELLLNVACAFLVIGCVLIPEGYTRMILQKSFVGGTWSLEDLCRLPLFFSTDLKSVCKVETKQIVKKKRSSMEARLERVIIQRNGGKGLVDPANIEDRIRFYHKLIYTTRAAFVGLFLLIMLPVMHNAVLKKLTSEDIVIYDQCKPALSQSALFFDNNSSEYYDDEFFAVTPVCTEFKVQKPVDNDNGVVEESFYSVRGGFLCTQFLCGITLTVPCSMTWKDQGECTLQVLNYRNSPCFASISANEFNSITHYVPKEDVKTNQNASKRLNVVKNPANLNLTRERPVGYCGNSIHAHQPEVQYIPWKDTLKEEYQNQTWTREEERQRAAWWLQDVEGHKFHEKYNFTSVGDVLRRPLSFPFYLKDLMQLMLRSMMRQPYSRMMFMFAMFFMFVIFFPEACTFIMFVNAAHNVELVQFKTK